MKKVEVYIEILKNIKDWDDYLMQESGLPGPRGNLELIEAVAQIGTEEQFCHLLSYSPETAPVNSPQEFLAACGTVGLGRLAAEGQLEYLELLRSLASDPRWRTREGVAMALQLFGDTQMDKLINEMKHWSQGSYYEKRAAAAALCEPRLLGDKQQVAEVLQILDTITASIINAEDRKDDGFVTLRKGMAYCWSVAIVHNPDEGKRYFEKWLMSQDKDIKWIIKENLKKDRLKRMDEAWVLRCNERIGK